MPKAIVLGAGMVGSVMAADLASDPDFTVTVADSRAQSLAAAKVRAPRLATLQADLSDPRAVRELVAGYDLVLGAIASPIGFQTLRAVIEAGKNYCDITFMAEDAADLDELAKQHGVTCVVDCGVAPGMSHMLAGYEVGQFDECRSIEIYVGGLPRNRRWPFQYKAPFAPSDVIEEYTRPARIVEHGKIVVREALSEPELMNFEGVGTLEAFNSDGLRSLAYSLKVPFMKEKTLRYPGHIELMRVFRATGLFSKDEIVIGEVKVRPLEVTSALMFPLWQLQPGEEELTVMRVIARGLKNGREERHIWDLLDVTDQRTNTTSMARTTAFPCTIMARMVARGEFQSAGVNLPEAVGARTGMIERVIAEHERRGVQYSRRVETVD